MNAELTKYNERKFMCELIPPRAEVLLRSARHRGESPLIVFGDEGSG